MSRRSSVLILALAIALLAGPDRAKASPPNGPVGKEVTFRGYPAPETQLFFLLQFGLIYIPGAEESERLTFDAGVMKNVGSSWAVGGNFHAEGGDDMSLGALVRGRRWLSRSVSVDLATGLLSPSEEQSVTYGGNETSWITQANMNLANMVTLTVQADRWKSSYQDPLSGSHEEGSGTDWYVGGSIQYLPGVIAFLGLVGLVAASL